MSIASTEHSFDTYEATKARQSTFKQPDKIHWDKSNSFRQNPYRQLHHQKGIIGTFDFRLLEASNLKRSYWSALALGPVKHLGLSKAHGAISSFCTLTLGDESKKSPVISNNDHPVWTNCAYTMALRKGVFGDGAPVVLKVEMAEDATAAEQMGLPGVPSPQERILGNGVLNLVDLCLGQDKYGKPQSGVLDAWIPISKNETITGRVRVLVSYQPNGMEPQPNDLVALEAFARRSLLKSSCRPMLPPLLPLKVLQKRDNWLLCEYSMLVTNTTVKKATIRIHRNALFVIERTNIIDGAINLALTPSDMFFNTPVGRTTAHVAEPIVGAAIDLIQPALLGTRVLWAALRTTTFAGMTGVQAATHAVWATSRDAQERRDYGSSFRQASDHEEETLSSSQHHFV
jgi:hypothetical protein